MKKLYIFCEDIWDQLTVTTPDKDLKAKILGQFNGVNTEIAEIEMKGAWKNAPGAAVFYADEEIVRLEKQLSNFLSEPDQQQVLFDMAETLGFLIIRKKKLADQSF